MICKSETFSVVGLPVFPAKPPLAGASLTSPDEVKFQSLGPENPLHPVVDKDSVT